METIVLFLALAVTVEGLVEYVKNIIEGERWAVVIQLCALVVAVALCVLARADIYASLGVTFSVPYVGCVLTGIFASRGANYASDILGKLQSSGGKYAA